MAHRSWLAHIGTSDERESSIETGGRSDDHRGTSSALGSLMNRVSQSVPLLLSLLLVAACGGATEDEANEKDPSGQATVGTVVPPAAATPHFTLRVDGKPIELEEPYSQRGEISKGADATSYVTLGAQAPRRGDFLQGASILLVEPITAGEERPCSTEDGTTSTGTLLTVSDQFVGFTSKKMTECTVRISYAAEGRIVGSFVTDIVPPDGASGVSVARGEGDFDVPVK